MGSKTAPEQKTQCKTNPYMSNHFKPSTKKHHTYYHKMTELEKDERIRENIKKE